jgi:hypothetical protein
VSKAGAKMPAHGGQFEKSARAKLEHGYRWAFRKRQQKVSVDAPGTLTLDINQLMIYAAVAGLEIASDPLNPPAQDCREPNRRRLACRF